MSAKSAYVLLSICAVLFSSHALLITWAAYDARGALLGRTLMAAATLLAFKISWPRNKRQLAAAACFAGSNICFVFASSLTAVANAVVLVYVYPFASLGLNRLIRKQRVDWSEFGLILLGFVGVIAIFAQKISIEGLWGNLLSCCAGICFAGFLFVSRDCRSNAEVAGSILGGQAIGVLAAILLLAGHPPAAPTMQQVLILITLGVASGIPFLLMSKAARFVPDHIAAVALMLEVPLAAIVAWVAFGQSLNAISGLGIALVTAAAYKLGRRLNT